MTIIVRPWPRSAAKFPQRNVIGEIKPHNTDGISDGIRQLFNRKAARLSVTPQLLTYRSIDPQRIRYEVLAADSDELRKSVAAWQPRQRAQKPRTWYRLPTLITLPAAAEMIPRWQCATQLGNVLEKHVRRAYTDAIRIPPLPDKHPSRPGPDIEHELLMAEFLRELAAELEAEAEAGL